MTYQINIRCLCVRILTLCCISLLSGCAVYKDLRYRYAIPCKNHAHLQFIFEDYVSRRFHSQSPIRVAVVPFSVPANLAYRSAEFPGVGNELAWKLHADLLQSGRIPIVEVFNRQDWPGKKDEFFTGNFGAISFARQAGYDLVLVGNLELPRQLGSLTAQAKLIEVESGVTVWYGESTINESYGDYQRERQWWWWYDKKRPDKLMGNQLVEDLAQCLTNNVLSDDYMPE
ncbi:MAG: hypothetical protein KDD62_00125 [Bdellovibrionales bacterium]|nr:hypothetical protein [Bdellovibrionales bacterium]